ncbi:hypothetical protein [Brunnivagina elsteri]|uniref:Uncharacterized protein n=1 Tax=Brunnivagina elsteri CCALA 953 TaxID=987040 RepID=A0A2A2TLQ5_9CYAN|nr:hypothetical protein [Calothrix elsteri]PAX58464.1 hypothetical protein CK510_07300 [Calothrix elsteri CCALA 953]
MLETRVPVSNIIGVFSQKALFLVNECTLPLYYFPSLDALACLAIENNQLKLFDLVTSNLNFPLQALLEQIPKPIEEISIYFSPDCLQVDTQALAETFEGIHYSWFVVDFLPKTSNLRYHVRHAAKHKPQDRYNTLTRYATASVLLLVLHSHIR